MTELFSDFSKNKVFIRGLFRKEYYVCPRDIQAMSFGVNGCSNSHPNPAKFLEDASILLHRFMLRRTPLNEHEVLKSRRRRSFIP